MDTFILKNIYLTMYRIRAVEEEIARRYPKGKMRCPTHLSIGQELISSVFAELVNKKDYTVSTHRAHAHYLAKGGNLKKMIAEIYGKDTGCSHGNGGSMHLIDRDVNFMGSTGIVGGTIPIGVGLGLSIKLKNEDRISVVFLGDGATEEGVFYESVNFAILKQLPVLFICENNLYSVYSPLNVRRPQNINLQKYVSGLGIDGNRGNGFKLEDTYLKMKTAFEYVRNNRKPFFIELLTYRFKEHCGPNADTHLNYRSIEEYNEWLNNDPVIKYEKECLKLLNKNDIMNLKLKIDREIKEAFEFAENSPWPDYSKLNKYMFKG